MDRSARSLGVLDATYPYPRQLLHFELVGRQHVRLGRVGYRETNKVTRSFKDDIDTTCQGEDTLYVYLDEFPRDVEPSHISQDRIANISVIGQSLDGEIHRQV